MRMGYQFCSGSLLHWGGAILLSLWLFLVPHPVLAQNVMLRVSLHDAAGQGIAGITVLVRASDGSELARQITDADGSVSFTDLPAVVRVAVAGQPRGGPRLYQLGDDANGIRLALDQAESPVRLDLRVERDGLVLPDPATMLALEEGGPSVAVMTPIPTAALATPVPLITPAQGDTASIIVVGPPPAPESRDSGWVPMLTLSIIVIALGVLLVIQRRRSSR